MHRTLRSLRTLQNTALLLSRPFVIRSRRNSLLRQLEWLNRWMQGGARVQDPYTCGAEVVHLSPSPNRNVGWYYTYYSIHLRSARPTAGQGNIATALISNIIMDNPSALCSHCLLHRSSPCPTLSKTLQEQKRARSITSSNETSRSSPNQSRV